MVYPPYGVPSRDGMMIKPGRAQCTLHTDSGWLSPKPVGVV